MQKHEAAEIIDAIVTSLKNEPQQFQLSINFSIVGMSATAQSGGIAVQGIARGGGTGISVSASSGNVSAQIANDRAMAELNEELERLIDTLSVIAAEFRSDEPDASKLKTLYDSIKGTWVPGVITSLVGNLITSLAT